MQTQKSEYVKALLKQHYKVIGQNQHSAVKLCTWLKKSLKNQGSCYKQKFYGIRSHGCLQMTPNIYCPQRCVFCWRSWEFSPTLLAPSKWDEPNEIVDNSFEAQKKLLEGCYGYLESYDKAKLDEAQKPSQVAISLTGEPAGYPYLSDLIKAYEKRGCSVFLVTNGMYPEALENLETLPTQLYVSLTASNEEIHKKINAPMMKNSWEKLMQSLDLLKSLDTRTVIRLTAVEGINMVNSLQYADILKNTAPDFIEIKAYMFVGGSRQRLTINNMPRHYEVKEFADQINKELDYKYIDEQPESRVVLYSSCKKPQLIKF